MPITYPFPITGEGLAKLVTITKGNFLHRFTNWSLPITISGVTWTPEASCKFSNLVKRINGDVSNVQITVAASAENLIRSTDAIAGKYRGGDCLIELCNPFFPASGKTVQMQGYIGSIEEERSGIDTILRITARGNLSRSKGLQEEKYGATCTLDVGEDRCRVAILPADQTRAKVYVTRLNAATVDKAGTGYATRVRTASDGGLPTEYEDVYYECTTAGTTHASVQPSYNSTPGATTTDGTAVFTCRQAFVRAKQVLSIAANGFDVTLTGSAEAEEVDGYYSGGYAIVRAATNPDAVGVLLPIANWDSGSVTFVSWDNVVNVLTAGDYLEMITGCDHKRATCFTKFDNILNFHGYGTHAPGRSIADATT